MLCINGNTISRLSPLIILALVTATYSQDFSNFGQQIAQSVNKGLAPLNNLGWQISKQVNNQLQFLREPNFPFYGYPDYQRNFQPPVPDLSHLGEQIQQQVNQGLEPVRALAVYANMRNGIGGVTIVTFLPEGRKFIVSNHRIFQCIGNIDSRTGMCSGSLEPYKVKSNSDYCYFKIYGYSIVNDKICIGASSIAVVNNNIICQSSDPAKPAALFTVDQFNRICGGKVQNVEYKYIANVNDPRHVPIPNENRQVKCSNNEHGVCVFTESMPVPASNGNIIINNSY